MILASNRGQKLEDGSYALGGMISAREADWHIMIKVLSDCKVSGLRIKGNSDDRHVPHHTRSFYTDKPEPLKYYFSLPVISVGGVQLNGDNIEVSNCEVTGFCWAAIALVSDGRVCNSHIHHNYIHHNQAKGLGYGVSHSANTVSLVEYNLFNFNRHDVAATGAPYTGYVARYNINMGDSLDHVYDMHGGSDRKDGTRIAGNYCDIYNNTMLCDIRPYVVRGVPQEYHKFHNNMVYAKRDECRGLEGENFELYNNVFGIDDMTLVK